MIDDDLTELISHPVYNMDDDIRCEIKEMYNLCQNSPSKRVNMSVDLQPVITHRWMKEGIHGQEVYRISKLDVKYIINWLN